MSDLLTNCNRPVYITYSMHSMDCYLGTTNLAMATPSDDDERAFGSRMQQAVTAVYEHFACVCVGECWI